MAFVSYPGLRIPHRKVESTTSFEGITKRKGRYFRDYSMKKIIGLFLACSVTLLTSTLAYGEASQVLTPSRTWLFAVGILHCKGIKVLLLGDCCHSGSLTDAIKKHDKKNEYAVISSSAKTEPGHGNWTFSEALLQALRGNPAADSNKDGYISLEEAKNFIKSDILNYENNHSAFATTNLSFTQMILAKADAKAFFAPKPVEVFYHGEWWTGKQLEANADSGHIRWMQLGFDTPEQDVWIELSKIRPLTPAALR
jgi:hypothetical protein